MWMGNWMHERALRRQSRTIEPVVAKLPDHFIS